MKRETLYQLIEDNLSGDAYDIAYAVADSFDEDEDITEGDFFDSLMDEVSSCFTYYSHAWKYLQDNGITDFYDAIHEWGATDIEEIACYYAQQEVSDAVSPEWDSYESQELELEEDEEE